MTTFKAQFLRNRYVILLIVLVGLSTILYENHVNSRFDRFQTGLCRVVVASNATRHAQFEFFTSLGSRASLRAKTDTGTLRLIDLDNARLEYHFAQQFIRPLKIEGC